VGVSIIRRGWEISSFFMSFGKKKYGFQWVLTHFGGRPLPQVNPRSDQWKIRRLVLRGSGRVTGMAIMAHNPKIKYFEGVSILYLYSYQYGKAKVYL